MTTSLVYTPKAHHTHRSGPDDAREMAKLATRLGKPVTAKLHGVKLTANPGDNANRLAHEWIQGLADLLVDELKELHFFDFKQVFDWMDRLSAVSNFVGVELPRALILDTFRQCGFEANGNREADYDADDATESARYIIGQCLADLADYGSFSGADLKSAVKRWMSNFAYIAA